MLVLAAASAAMMSLPSGTYTGLIYRETSNGEKTDPITLEIKSSPAELDLQMTDTQQNHIVAAIRFKFNADGTCAEYEESTPTPSMGFCRGNKVRLIKLITEPNGVRIIDEKVFSWEGKSLYVRDSQRRFDLQDKEEHLQVSGRLEAKDRN